MKKLLAALLLFAATSAHAAVETTTVQGKVYQLDGSVFTSGKIKLQLSDACSTTDGTNVGRAMGRFAGTIAADGSVTGVAPIPNDVCTPSGTYYTVTIATTAPVRASWKEKWQVDTSPDPVDIGSITRLEFAPGITVGDYMVFVATEPTGACTTADVPTWAEDTNSVCECVASTWSCSAIGGAETNSLETLITGILDNEVPIGSGADASVYTALPNCTLDTTEGLGYDDATNAWECHSITGSGHGDGANCGAGEINLGVDSAGAVQGCYEPAATDIASGVLAHERGGLEADVSGYTDGLYGMAAGVTADIDTLAELNTALGGIGVEDGPTAVNDLGDATGTGAVALGETEQVWTWNTEDTAGAFHGMQVVIINDASTDATNQRALYVVRADSSGTGTVEALQRMRNNDTDGAVTDAILIESNAGGITTAVNASGSNIVNALAIGSNDITTTSSTIEATELDLLDGGITESDVSDLSHTPDTADIADVSVTQTELAELETIGATTVSANQWAAIGGMAETLGSAELDRLDGIDAALVDLDDFPIWTSAHAHTSFVNIDNQNALRMSELDVNGTNYVSIVAPSIMSANRACSLQDDATPFDLCVTAEANDLEGSGAVGILDDEVPVGTGAGTVEYKLLTDCNAAGEAVQYDTATNAWGCITGLGAGGTVDDVTGDSGTTTGANVSVLGDTSGIDTSVTGDVLTVTFDPTERAATTWGAASDFAWTFNAGATDPTFTFASDSVAITNAATFTVGGVSFQPLDAELTTIAALGETTGNVMISVASAWASVAQPIIDCTNCTDIPAGTHTGTIAWGGTAILESGVAFQFGDASDATLTHTYANTGTNVDIAYSTGAMAVTGALSATNLSGTNTGDVAADSLDFTDFSDTMGLDADTTITLDDTEELTISATLTGGVIGASPVQINATFSDDADASDFHNGLEVAIVNNSGDAGDFTAGIRVQIDDGSADTADAGLLIRNNDTGGTLDGGVECSGLAITNCIDASDTDIVNALSIGVNNILTDGATIAATELDRLDGIDAALVDLDDTPSWAGAHTFGAETTVDDLGVEFTPGDALTDCSTFSATGGGLFYDDSEGLFKKCQDNVLTDLDTGGAETNNLETNDPPNVADTEIYIGTGPGAGAWAALSSDVTMTNAGVVTIAANAVTTAEITDDTITGNDIETTGQTDEYVLTYEATGPALEWQKYLYDVRVLHPHGMDQGGNDLAAGGAHGPVADEMLCWVVSMTASMADLDRIGMRVSGSDADDVAEIGIYSYDGATQYFECTMVVTTSSLNRTCANDDATPARMEVGDYWFCIGVDNATPGYDYRGVNATTRSGTHTESLTSGEMPATLTAPTPAWADGDTVPYFEMTDE